MVEQMLVSILRQGSYLIASIHEALNDREIVQFQQDLVEQIGTHRARGVIIDVAALDVMDSFGSRTLLNLAHAARLAWRGDRHRRHPADGRLRDGAPGHGPRQRPHRARPRGGPGVPAAAAPGTDSTTSPRDDRPAWCEVTGDAYERFRRDYAPAFLQYLSERGEPGRRAAYELGRRAITEQLSVLDLTRIHHAMLLEVLRTHRTPRELEHIAQAASEFLVEALAVFEMTQRGFAELLVDRPVRPGAASPDRGGTGTVEDSGAGHGRADGTPRPDRGHRRRADPAHGRAQGHHRRRGRRQAGAPATFGPQAAIRSIAPETAPRSTSSQPGQVVTEMTGGFGGPPVSGLPPGGVVHVGRHRHHPHGRGGTAVRHHSSSPRAASRFDSQRSRPAASSSLDTGPSEETRWIP